MCVAQLSFRDEQFATAGLYIRRSMKENIKYYVVKQKALPEVLLKVAEANRLIENQNISIADATEKV